ncbi:MAG: class I SAM-dependent methyltransferase [Ilumatobacteraceae bacterium]
MPGTSFDRVADHYDETRGGERRGDQVAAAIAPWVPEGRVVELGVGTGVVALGLRTRGHGVVGLDLSAGMMRTAVGRLGPRVAQADIDVLPVPDDSVDCAVFVWVLHLVADSAATMREAARVVRQGGRVIAVSADPEHHPDDEIAAAMAPFKVLSQGSRSVAVLRDGAPESFDLEHDGFTPWAEFEKTAAAEIDLIERRSYSQLFDLDDERWRTVVEPVLDQLRALPDPDAPRIRRNRNPLLVWRVS